MKRNRNTNRFDRSAIYKGMNFGEIREDRDPKSDQSLRCPGCGGGLSLHEILTVNHKDPEQMLIHLDTAMEHCRDVGGIEVNRGLHGLREREVFRALRRDLPHRREQRTA